MEIEELLPLKVYLFTLNMDTAWKLQITTEKPMDGWMDGWVGGWVDGWMDSNFTSFFNSISVRGVGGWY